MISKATISFIQSLKQKKYRQKYNKFLLEGEKIILEGLSEGNISFDNIFCLEEKVHLINHITSKYNIIDSKSLSKISNLKNAPGMIAVANVPAERVPAEKDLRGVTIYLDSIRDPGNMGTIIRTADWFGIRTILASEDSVDFYNPKVIQASMGSFARVNLRYVNVTDIPSHVPIYASTLDGESIYEFERPDDLILVIGSESHGVSEEVIRLATGKLCIPQSAGSRAESLNAGVACGVMIAELTYN